MLSRVVPAISLTTSRSSPSSRLMKLDLPTFGFPTTATASASSGGSSISGRCATRASSTSPDPFPDRALTGRGSPRPSSQKSRYEWSSGRLSTLLTTRTTGTSVFRSRSAIFRSRGWTPARVSTTKAMTSASWSAASTWRRMAAASGSFTSGSSPPVSTM